LTVVTTSKPRPEPEWLKEFKGKKHSKKEHATVSALSSRGGEG
jgi:hypothetical protein